MGCSLGCLVDKESEQEDLSPAVNDADVIGLNVGNAYGDDGAGKADSDTNDDVKIDDVLESAKLRKQFTEIKATELKDLMSNTKQQHANIRRI